LSLFRMPVNQCLSMCVTDLGGVSSVATWRILHIVLACWQSKKRCLIVSLQSHKQHFWLPTQFLLAKLSFVKITPRWRYHRKIFIFRGILRFQINLLLKGVPWFIKYWDLDWTVKHTCRCKSQVKLSLPCERCCKDTFATRLCQEVYLSPIRALRKERFIGFWFITFSTVSWG
jgi:hypothetical protein